MISARLGLVSSDCRYSYPHLRYPYQSGSAPHFPPADHTLDQHQDMSIVDLIDLDRLQLKWMSSSSWLSTSGSLLLISARIF